MGHFFWNTLYIYIFFFWDKVVKLVRGDLLSTGPTPSSLSMGKHQGSLITKLWPWRPKEDKRFRLHKQAFGERRRVRQEHSPPLSHANKRPPIRVPSPLPKLDVTVNSAIQEYANSGNNPETIAFTHAVKGRSPPKSPKQERISSDHCPESTLFLHNTRNSRQPVAS